MRIKKTHEQFMKDLKNKQPELLEKIEIIGKYNGIKEKIECRCKICSESWLANPDNLLSNGSGCPNCGRFSRTSMFEQVMYRAFWEALGVDKVLHNDKSLIGKELDIYIPSLKIAYEPGAWLWHKDKIEKDYNKYILCKEKGVKLITIYDAMRDEIDMDFKHDVIKFKKPMTQDDAVSFVKAQFKELGIDNNIDWNEILKESIFNCAMTSHKEFMKKFKQQQPESFSVIEVLSKYKGAKEEIICKCKICGNLFKTTPDKLLAGRGCRYRCAYDMWSKETIEKVRERRKGGRKENKPDIKIKVKKIMVCDCCDEEFVLSPKRIDYNDVINNRNFPCLCPKCKYRINTRFHIIHKENQTWVEFAKEQIGIIKKNDCK